MKTVFIGVAAVVALVTHVVAQSTVSTDWPQWQGPDRNGISRETGLAKSWPSGGPPVVWSISGLGNGYGGVAVKDGRIFVQGMRGKLSLVHSLNISDGQYV